jgi:hypothetical protein
MYLFEKSRYKINFVFRKLLLTVHFLKHTVFTDMLNSLLTFMSLYKFPV